MRWQVGLLCLLAFCLPLLLSHRERPGIPDRGSHGMLASLSHIGHMLEVLGHTVRYKLEYPSREVSRRTLVLLTLQGAQPLLGIPQYTMVYEAATTSQVLNIGPEASSPEKLMLLAKQVAREKA